MSEHTEQFTPHTNAAEVSAEQMLSQVLAQKIKDGALEQAISKQVDKLIQKTAENTFCSYGEIGRALKEQLTSAIMPGAESLEDLPRYHHFVVNRLKLAAQNFYDNRLAEVLDKELNEIMTELPETITLSWLVEKVIQSAREEENELEGEITLLLEEPYWSSGGDTFMLHIDKEADKEARECRYDIHLSKNRETGNYDVLGVRIDGTDSRSTLCFGNLYRFEKALFNIYAMKGQVVLDQGEDPDNYETSWDDY